MSTAPWSSSDDDAPVTPALVASLLAREHPDLASLPLGTWHEGWNATTVRLGDRLAVRIPRSAAAARRGDLEHAWMPRLAPAWSFRAPVPVRTGSPSDEVPWAWSVVPWLEGVPAYTSPLSGRGAGDLGRALAELHVPAPAEAPRGGVRAAPLAMRAERFDDRVERLLAAGVPVDAARAREEFEAGAVQRRPLETWTHQDLHGAHVLTDGGRLAGVLDWGDLTAGDPATDLGQAWCLVGSARVRDLLKGYRRAVAPLDESAMLRIRAEALAFAVALAALDEQRYADAGRAALADLEVLAA